MGSVNHFCSSFPTGICQIWRVRWGGPLGRFWTKRRVLQTLNILARGIVWFIIRRLSQPTSNRSLINILMRSPCQLWVPVEKKKEVYYLLNLRLVLTTATSNPWMYDVSCKVLFYNLCCHFLPFVEAFFFLSLHFVLVVVIFDEFFELGPLTTSCFVFLFPVIRFMQLIFDFTLPHQPIFPENIFLFWHFRRECQRVKCVHYFFTEDFFLLIFQSCFGTLAWRNITVYSFMGLFLGWLYRYCDTDTGQRNRDLLSCFYSRERWMFWNCSLETPGLRTMECISSSTREFDTVPHPESIGFRKCGTRRDVLNLEMRLRHESEYRSGTDPGEPLAVSLVSDVSVLGDLFSRQ